MVRITALVLLLAMPAVAGATEQEPEWLVTKTVPHPGTFRIPMTLEKGQPYALDVSCSTGVENLKYRLTDTLQQEHPTEVSVPLEALSRHAADATS